jgi:methionyl-tRNA formyltransferase
MRLVFAGTPEFARVSLTALHAAGHQVLAVLTQPDRPAGRGLEVTQGPVKREAERLGIPVAQPLSLRDGRPGASQASELLQGLAPDLMVVAAYGLILPPQILAIPRWGCLNIHASLLPRWRGAAPIQRAIEAGDRQTGISLMQMEEGLDTGPVWASEALEISPRDTFQTLHDRLAALGAQSLVALLSDFPLAGHVPCPQAADGVTYAHKLTRDDASIDWSESAARISGHIRALDPVPGATTTLLGAALKVFSAQEADIPAPSAATSMPAPGTIVRADRQGVIVACGHGFISLGAFQRSGGRRMDVGEFLNGHKVSAGQCFESVTRRVPPVTHV